jgi:hypothetical protein
MKIIDIIDKLNNKWVTPIVAMITAIYGMVFGFYFNKINLQEKKLKQVETSLNTKLREKEFINNLRLTLYQEVKQSMKTQDTNQQKITLLLIDELLKEDTSFRDKLVTLVLSHTTSATLIKEQNEFMTFNENEKQIQGRWNISVFWLEDIPEESKPRAEKIATLIKEKYPNTNVNVRKLSKMINSKSGYRISQNLVRAEKSEYRFATDIINLVNRTNILENEKLILTNSNTNSFQNFSIFIRNM